MRKHRSLSETVAGAWVVVLLAGLMLPAISKANLPAPVRIGLLVLMPVGLVALVLAVIGSLMLAAAWLKQPVSDEAGDYEDQLTSDPGKTAEEQAPE